MNRILLSISAPIVVWALSSTWAMAQGIPGMPPGVQNVMDRQAERAQEQALERAQQQAAEQAAQQASQQVLDRVQNQTVDQVAEQTTGRAQNQAAGQAAQQAAQQTARQAQNRILNQADSVQNQALERVQTQAGRVQGETSERAQAQMQRVQDVPGRVANRSDNNGLENRAVTAPAIGRAPGQGQSEQQNSPQSAGQGNNSLFARAPDVPPAVYPGPLAQLPERLPINDNQGNEAFVEIRIEPNIRILDREWVMLINADQRQTLMNQAPVLLQFLQETIPFEALNSFLLRFRVPPDIDSEDAVQQLLPESLQNLIDRNHVYSAQSEVSAQVTLLPLPMMSVCNRQVSVGMIDSAVREDHPAFAPGGRRTPLVTRDFIDQNLVQPSGHGTAVAGVMVGHTQGLQPLLPNATLYSASVVYAQDAYNQGATVLNMMQALDWLISIEDLQVINISMTGPPNRLLEQGVAAAQSRGKVIVAAAGNEGPFAPALYPAAYEGVITTTAVAVDTSIYRWANQGEHVDFAALGVSVVTARGDGTVGAESGTSMATPIVSAFFACELAAQAGDKARALENLRSRAIDLGVSGHDPVFGHGLLHP